MPNHLGDFIMALGLIREIFFHRRGAHVSLVCKDNFVSLAHVALGKCDVYPLKGNNLSHISQMKKIKTRFDEGVLLTNSGFSALAFSFLKIEHVVGFDRLLGSLYFHGGIPLDPHRKRTEHQVDTYKRLLPLLGKKNTGKAPCIELTGSQKKQGQDLLHAQGIHSGDTVLGIHASSVYGKAKCYPLDQHRELIREFLKGGARRKVVIIGLPCERQELNVLAAVDDRVVNMAGQTDLETLCFVISACDVFVSNDSGPMHLADALGVKLVALFGSSNPQVTAPYSQPFSVMRVSGLKCMPCFSKQCPEGHFNCMRQIAPQSILKRVERLLSNEKKRESESCIS